MKKVGLENVQYFSRGVNKSFLEDNFRILMHEKQDDDEVRRVTVEAMKVPKVPETPSSQSVPNPHLESLSRSGGVVAISVQGEQTVDRAALPQEEIDDVSDSEPDSQSNITIDPDISTSSDNEDSSTNSLMYHNSMFARFLMTMTVLVVLVSTVFLLIIFRSSLFTKPADSVNQCAVK